MGQQLSPEQEELYRRVDEVLHYLWDPIGVSNVPEARDEYYSYLPRVCSLLTSGDGAREIADFLTHVSTERMGLSNLPRGREHDQGIASILMNRRDVIHERYAA